MRIRRLTSAELKKWDLILMDDYPKSNYLFWLVMSDTDPKYSTQHSTLCMSTMHDINFTFNERGGGRDPAHKFKVIRWKT